MLGGPIALSVLFLLHCSPGRVRISNCHNFYILEKHILKGKCHICGRYCKENTGWSTGNWLWDMMSHEEEEV